MTRNLDVPDEYAALYRVYEDAYEQASEGKGKERHAEAGEPYEDQIICEVARRVGLGYPLGQAVKKIYESQRIGGERGVAELLGALNYVAAAVIVMREGLGLEVAPKAEECGYKKGDTVLVAMPDGEDVQCVYAGESERPGCCCVRYLSGDNSGDTDDTVPLEALRRPSETENGCCQNGKDQPKAEAQRFKPGDRVQYRVELPSVSDRLWVEGEYVRYEKGRSRPHVVFASATLELVSDEDIRPAPKADEEPEFKCGDKVEVQMMPDSSTWASAAITAVYRDKDTCEWRYCVGFDDGWTHVVVPSARVRPVSSPKAEGCEALVEKDAPQTREELCQRIVDSNPANYKPRNLWEGLTRLNIKPTFEPHKATGEELAEMAEEDGNA